MRAELEGKEFSISDSSRLVLKFLVTIVTIKLPKNGTCDPMNCLHYYLTSGMFLIIYFSPSSFKKPCPLCHGAITLSSKGRFNGVCNATIYKSRTLPSIIQCGTFCLNHDILPNPILWHPRYKWAPCIPHPLGRLARHQSRLWVGFDTTCHGTITIFSKRPIWWGIQSHRL